VLQDQEFVDGKLDTGFIERFFERQESNKPDRSNKDLAIIAAALASASSVSSDPKPQTNAKPSRWATSAGFSRHLK
jgi:acetyl/propionyl-CoA carboxylase alpha subunit